MEDAELIKSGLDAVSQMIFYLAKDALGSEFLSAYAKDRSVQAEAMLRQRESLDKLLESSGKMEQDAKIIAESAGNNIKRLQAIYDAIDSLRESVFRIEEEHRRYVSKFKALHEETKGISKLIEEIQNISEQTSLLSFNASIEAAHAGSAGAGFRIIANEVKKLSDSTKKTTEKIRQNVGTLTDAIGELENGTKQNASSLHSLTDEAEDTLKKFDTMRKLNSENNANVEKIGESITDNVRHINGMIAEVAKAEDVSKGTVQLFADCASKNQMLFNDLYSFSYELKAILEDLGKNESL